MGGFRRQSWIPSGGGLLATALAVLLLGCGAAEDESRSANVAPASDTELQTLETRLNRIEREVDRVASNKDEPYAAILADARAEWRRRFDRCRDDACRRSVLADRLARAEYAFGDRARRFPGLGFPGGRIAFRSQSGAVRGDVRIYPLVDDRLLVDFVSVSERAICEFVAEGRATPDGGIRMTARADLAGEQVATEWEMQAEPAGRLSIRAVGEDRNWFCGTRLSIPATYEIVEVNGEPRN